MQGIAEQERHSMTLVEPTRDVQTQLRYSLPRPGNSIVTDFTQPGAEQAYALFESSSKSYPTTIQDIRGRQDKFSWDVHGFQYVHHKVPALKEARTEDQISEVLLPATEELVRNLTGATKTVTFMHRIRNKESDDAKRGDNRAPAHSVHSDFTPTGAMRNLTKVIKDPVERAELEKGRILAVNVWRPLKKIRRDPLAICDWRGVDYKRDWIENRMIFPNDWYELGAVCHDAAHQWYFLNEQTPDEPLVFTQFDSKMAGKGGMCVAHTAFMDPEHTNAETRESVEIKMYAFLPDYS